jgi:hypothetical protein
MDICKEADEPIEVPMPVDPRKVRREQPVPTAPVEQPAEPVKQYAQRLRAGEPVTDIWADMIIEVTGSE